MITRYERTRSALDMGNAPQIVRPGGHLSFVPSAAIVIRRSALTDVGGFDEDLHLGEDVDLCWRLSDAGWTVRYEPRVVVRHQVRSDPTAWLRRRFQYGTSAADLDSRHPGRLTPARPSPWNVAALGLAATGHGALATTVAGTAGMLLRHRLKSLPAPGRLSAKVLLQGLAADAAGIGHLLRREWWPIGAIALATASQSRLSRAAVAAMLAPIAWEIASQAPQIDPIRYTLLRLIDDAAYGTGVIASCLRSRNLAPLLPLPAGKQTPRQRDHAPRPTLESSGDPTPSRSSGRQGDHDSAVRDTRRRRRTTDRHRSP